MKKIYNPSALMSAYNAAKRYGRRSGALDQGRIDRAFGYLMSGRERRLPCKHTIAMMIDRKHDQLMTEFKAQAAEAAKELSHA